MKRIIFLVMFLIYAPVYSAHCGTITFSELVVDGRICIAVSGEIDGQEELPPSAVYCHLDLLIDGFPSEVWRSFILHGAPASCGGSAESIAANAFVQLAVEERSHIVLNITEQISFGDGLWEFSFILGDVVTDGVINSIAIGENKSLGGVRVQTAILGLAEPNREHSSWSAEAPESGVGLISHSMYPNPVRASGYLVLWDAQKMASQDGNVTVEFDLFDLRGRRLHRLTAHASSEIGINLRELGLAAGVYLVNTRIDGRRFATSKLVVIK